MASIEWETPQDFFNAVNAEFTFDIDVCASENNAKVQKYFSIYDNALNREWEGSCWMNPPYDKDIGKWVSKAYWSAQKGATVVCLLQGRSCDTKWFHSYIMKSTEIRFVKDRLHFGMNGKFSRANISSMLVIFKPLSVGYPIVSAIDTKGNPVQQISEKEKLWP